MKNIGALIKAHNTKVEREANEKPKKQCNCTRKYKGNCPLNGKCLSEAIIYKATVKSRSGSKNYIGLTGGRFKDRLGNHVLSFNHKKDKHATELSKHVWSLKDKKEQYEITWSIVDKSNTFRRKTGTCNLCLAEKVAILHNKKLDTNNSLNSRK